MARSGYYTDDLESSFTTSSSYISTATSPPAPPSRLRNPLLPLLLLLPIFALTCYYVALFVAAHSVIIHDAALPSYAAASSLPFLLPNATSFAALFTVTNPSQLLPFRIAPAQILLSYNGTAIGEGVVDGVFVAVDSSEEVMARGRVVDDVENFVGMQGGGHDGEGAVELGMEIKVSSKVGNKMFRFKEKFWVVCKLTVDNLKEGAKVLASSCNSTSS